MTRHGRTVLTRLFVLAAALFGGAAFAAPPLLSPVELLPGNTANTPAPSRSQAFRVRFNQEAARALRPGDEADFPLPNGRRYGVIYDQGIDHGRGITSWIGYLKNSPDRKRVVITTGPTGSFGRISTPEGDFRLAPGQGHDWLVDMNAESAFLDPIDLRDDAKFPPPQPKRTDAPVHQPSYYTVIPGVNAPLTAKMHQENVFVDLMIVYTNGLATQLGEGLMTRINNWVASTNTAYVDSHVHITLRLVHTLQVTYPDSGAGFDTDDALYAISPFDPDGGGGPLPVGGTGVFSAIEGLRNTHGADMVAFWRSGGDFGGNGIAWVANAPITTGNAAGFSNIMYSVTTGCVLGCDSVMQHELGHNMGNMHDRHTVAWQAGGVAAASIPQGSTAYAYGYAYCESGLLACNPNILNANDGPGNACGPGEQPECSTGNWCMGGVGPTFNNFTDIMAYFHCSAFNEPTKFSNPGIACQGPPGPGIACGIAGGNPNAADAARSMNENAAGLSAIKPAVAAPGPPDAPTIGTATAGVGLVTVTFTPGNLNSGVLTNHHVTCAAATGPAFNGFGASSPIVVTGLLAGTAYRCWARTVTNLGTSAWSMATNFATPTGAAPSAPTIGTATAGAGQVSVTFTPGSLNGGVLTNHHVTCTAATGPAFNGNGSSSPIVVSGLTGGTAYRCWARTITNLGTSAWSGASNYATPTTLDGPPGAPTMGMATAGPGQVSVTFTPGALNGGVLTHHHVTCTAASGPAFNGYGSMSPIVVTGLTSGTAYRCWARTVTNLGTSAWSGASNFATPTNGPPAAPVIGMATAGAAQVSVAFTPGSLNGGVLTHHHVTCTAASGPAFNGYGSASPIVVAGLTSGTAYRCWARTVTNLGTGAWSGASNFATPTNGPPASPTMVMAMAGNGQVSVSFTPGSLNGGVLTHHHATCAAATGPAFNNTGAGSPIVVAGLTNGTAYRCWVRTITNMGTGAWSMQSNFATPSAM